MPAYALFAGVLAAAGLPIYLHAPKFFFDQYGVSLGALGSVLFGLRLFDVIQDPVLGWLSGVLERKRRVAVALVGTVMAAAMVCLFAIAPPFAPLAWFALTLGLLFTAFSFLTITFYAQGVEKAGRAPGMGHVRLASWRETGALIGVCLAAVAPTLLAVFSPRPFTIFAVFFAVAAIAAVVAMRSEWRATGADTRPAFRAILADPGSRRLLWIAFANAAPVAVTSTLFLFFVEYRLEAPGLEGPLLLLFFVAAAISAPLWGRAATRYGLRRAMLSGMVLAIVTFTGAAFLGAGDVVPFALVCLASGAALGADMTLLPAAFSTHVAAGSGNPGQAFGLWNFVSKFTLAFAAVTVLPALDMAGLSSDRQAGEGALITLTLLYAVLPCALKLIALWLLVSSTELAALDAPAVTARG
ncbi:MFS transporter [Chachezhania antarctica]|uniref:MFS transporter n=1 Tax=Chachezhania antarctica TaxID=2340860 RepID=UPI001F08B493|nr:MFS transporter [Chachezhania antarctica]